MSENYASCWTELPVEVQMLVVSHLPFEAAIKFEIVSKQWSAFLSSPHFRSLWAAHKRNIISYFVFSMERGTWASSTMRCHWYSSLASGEAPTPQPHRLPPLMLASLRMRFLDEALEPAHSAAGLVLCMGRSGFRVGNPLTRHWVKVPPIMGMFPIVCRRQFFPYTSEGQTFFKFWIEPYLFDSRIGVWTLPEHQTLWVCSHNTLHLRGTTYALAQCRQHNALVLLDVKNGDLSSLSLGSSSFRWVHAWDVSNHGFVHPYMVEVGGGVGIITQQEDKLVVLVLGPDSSGSKHNPSQWQWSKASTFPAKLDSHSFVGFACTHGNLTFVCVGDGLVAFDSHRLTWEWVESMTHGFLPYRVVLWEPSLAATPSLNEPSEELSKQCASKKYASAKFVYPDAITSFSGVDAMFKSGMSWQDIGRLAVDPNKANFVARNL